MSVPARWPFPERRRAAGLLVGSIVAAALTLTLVQGGEPAADLILGPILALLLAVGIGLRSHPYRALGFVPAGLSLLTVLAMLLAFWPGGLAWQQIGPGIWLGVALGFILGGTWAFAKCYGLAFAPEWLGGIGATTLLLIAVQRLGGSASSWPIGVAVGCLTLLAWVRLLRPALELAVRPVVGGMYQLVSQGPGLGQVPLQGPVLIVANHAAYCDPLFLAHGSPRPFVAMMTAGFYDLPILRPLVQHVFRAIRVSETAMKRETPEIAAAVNALRTGECVVIFPEGYLRRSEEVPLKRFGRGCWELLREEPLTPIIPCWIEGSWGSFFSFAGGPPMRKKRPDLRRRITITWGDATMVPLAVLQDHMTTRKFLQERVLAARTLALGEQANANLPPLELPDESRDSMT